MARNQSAIFVIVIGQIIFSAISKQAWAKFDYNKTLNNLISAREFDNLRILDSILYFDWTKNQECFNELKAIKSGVNHQEEWAIKCE